MQSSELIQSILIITGMHRSGTSLAASLLQSAGVNIGERLLPPGQGNIKGYFENLDFVEFHEDVLHSQGFSKAGWSLEKQIEVQEQYLHRAKSIVKTNSSNQLYWGWKDPRTTFFLKFWSRLIPEAYFILLYREPWGVIDSLYRRGNSGDEIFEFNPNFALTSWMNYNKELINFYGKNSEKCILLSINSIIKNPNFIVKVIQEKWGICLNAPAGDIYDNSLLNTQLSSSQRPALIKHCFPEAWELYQELNAKALIAEGCLEPLPPETLQLPSYETWVLQDWIDIRKTQRQLKRSQSQLQQTQDELERSQSQIQQTQDNLERSQSQLQQTQDELERSQSQLQQTQDELERSQSQLQQTQEELERSQSQLQQTQDNLERSQTLILAMESSKFWKLRRVWFVLKRVLGLPIDGEPARSQPVPNLLENSQVGELPIVGEKIEQTATSKLTEGWRYHRTVLRVKQMLAIVRTQGVRYTSVKLLRKIAQKLENEPQEVEILPEIPSSDDVNYQQWLNRNYPRQADLKKMAEMLEVLNYKPVISVIMPVFNTPEFFLRGAIESVFTQVYPYWELCIADDASPQSHVRTILEEYTAKDNRIKVVFRTENGHISRASNSALEMATGDFVAFLDHDDLLTPDALYEVALLLNRHPNADMIYSDEDKIDENNQLRDAFFKPDWCPDSFLSRMYTCHLGAYRRSLVNEIGGFRAGYEGSQDYDLVLRFTEKTENIFHIPKILYHWRIHAASTASSLENKTYAVDAATKALVDTLQRRGETGKVIPAPDASGHYLIRYDINKVDLVSIIIPTRNLGKTLDNCLNSIFEKTIYPNYEVILIDNGSTESKTLDVIRKWQESKPNQFQCYSLDIPFNYSKINNFAVQHSTGKYLLFLNNDTEVITPDWINAMVEQAQRPSIGAVGALLLYPDNTIQHAGVVAGLGGIANHSHKHFPVGSPGYFNHINTINNFSAVTAACLMCRRDVFDEVGGFEEELAVAFNDVDLCFKIVEKGYRNIYLPHVKLYHYESKSRGCEDTQEKQNRFIQEVNYMQQKWKKIIDHDPCYSPNLTKSREDYSIKV